MRGLELLRELLILLLKPLYGILQLVGRRVVWNGDGTPSATPAAAAPSAAPAASGSRAQRRDLLLDLLNLLVKRLDPLLELVGGKVAGIPGLEALLKRCKLLLERSHPLLELQPLGRVGVCRRRRGLRKCQRGR